MLSIVSAILSVSTKSMAHPVSFMVVILMQTIITCLITSLLNSSPWFAFVLFLIFMGGVMVLFVYMSSMASNENFSWTPKELIAPVIFSALVFLLAMIWNSNFTPHLNLKSMMITLSVYSNKFTPFVLYVIIYLLITMLIVSSVVKKNKAPIRAMK